MINSTVLTGRLTKEPEIRYSQSGTAFANGTLAVGRSYPNRDGQREADFIRISASGKRAETFANNFHKGELMGVEGSIKTGSYEKNGQTVYTTEVDVSRFTFLTPKNNNAQNGQQGGYSQNQGTPAPQGPYDGGIDITDSDLPF